MSTSRIAAAVIATLSAPIAGAVFQVMVSPHVSFATVLTKKPAVRLDVA